MEIPNVVRTGPLHLRDWHNASRFNEVTPCIARPDTPIRGPASSVPRYRWAAREKPHLRHRQDERPHGSGAGRMVEFFNVGRLNNVDLRDRWTVGGEERFCRP